MARASDEGKERVRRLATALLTELVKAPASGSNQAMAEEAVHVDGLADDLLAVEAEVPFFSWATW